jgi:hypothetical protein
MGAAAQMGVAAQMGAEGSDSGVPPAGPCGCLEVRRVPLVREDSQASRCPPRERTPVPRNAQDLALA